MKRIFAWGLPLCLCLIANGCATIGGAPKRPYTQDYAKNLSANESMKRLLGEGLTDQERDKHLFNALSVVDLRYNEFREALASERKHTSSIADAATLAMTVASSLTNSKGVKEHYLQGIALLTGGMNIYDKDYLQSQTITALIAQMDANRKSRMVEILKSIGNSIDRYPGPAAYNDVLLYYQEGTVLGAIMGIQRDAKDTEQSKANEIPALMQQVR